MKEWIVKHKYLMIAIVAVIVLNVGGLTAYFMIKKDQPVVDKPSVDQTVTYEFEHYQLGESESLNNHEDIGVMIADFDSAEKFKTYSGMVFSNKRNRYVQGLGSINVTDMRYHSFPTSTFDPIDISAYEKGSLHLSVYVNDPKYFGDTGLTIELSSSGKWDREELSWTVSARFLKSGWNELYLGFDKAAKAGVPNLTAINFFRAYNLSVDTCAEVYLDALYVTKTPGMDFNVYPSTKPGYLLDFDSTDAINSMGTISFTNEKGMYKEGVGAVKVTNPKTIWAYAQFKPIDVSKYQRLSFWLHVDNDIYIKDANIFVELTSSGKWDREEVYWIIAGSTLQTGWNEIVLPFETATAQGEAKFNATNANFFRIYATNCSEEVTVIVDGLKAENSTTRVVTDGVISDCDTKSVFSSVNGKVTSTDGEFQQGAGAIKWTQAFDSTKLLIWRADFKDLNDLSKYKEGGITLRIFVDDISKLTGGAFFEIRSGAKSDTDEYQWNLTSLESGWNEVRLPFADATVAGEPDLTKLRTMRIWASITDEVTIIVDDICVVEDASEKLPEGSTDDSAVEGMLFSGDSFKYMKSLSPGINKITRTKGEYVQGTGAYKSVGVTDYMILKGLLYEPKDISSYLDGGIQFSLYINDKSLVQSDNIQVELTSSGIHDKNEIYWTVSVANLNNGWNTVNLLFENAKAQKGDIDYTQVNYMRIFFPDMRTSKDVVVLVDNLHAVHLEDAKEPLPEGTTDDVAVEGMLFSGDSLDHVEITYPIRHEITREEGEYVQGTGAYKCTGADMIRFRAILKEPKDISDYASGGLLFSLYVKNPSAAGAKTLYVELTSSGRPDVEELEWAIPVDSLSDGWNTLRLNFADVANKGIDFTQVDYMRIRFDKELIDKEFVMMIDNVHAFVEEYVSCYYLADGAIYQAEKPLVIWGTGKNGVEMKAQLYKGGTFIAEDEVTIENSKWELLLPGQVAGYTEYSVKLFVNGKEVRTYSNILFGEVWLAAGQSNMQLKLSDSYGGAEAIQAANDPYMRAFLAIAKPEGNGARTTPADDITGQWIVGDTEGVGTLSAVAYHYAMSLRQELDVPIAFMDVAVGSATIESWLCKEMVDTVPELKAEMQKLNVYKTTPTDFRDLGALYYSKISPLTHTNIAGVIWYQGEGNRERASVYAEQLDLLKQKWGEEFGFENDSMPFIFTQIAPYGYKSNSNQMLITELMDEMSTFYRAHTETTAMITIYDIDLRYLDAKEPATIHPTTKKPVGERMALAAMGLVYGKSEATAPILESYTKENGKFILKFSHVGTGLKLSNDSIGVLGFALSDASGIWVNATAELIDANTVHVYSNLMNEPLYVSYAYYDMNTDANLSASNGIMAAPFRTGGTDGLGSRSYLNCDGTMFVVDPNGVGTYQNIWTIVKRSENTFDSSNRVQGTASVKSAYEAGTGEVVTGFDLSVAKRVSATAGLKNIGTLSVKMKNADERQKSVRLAITSANGNIAYTEQVMLAANANFDTLLFDLNNLYDENGNKISNYKTIRDNMVKLAFHIEDIQAGCVWIDDIKLGVEENVSQGSAGQLNSKPTDEHADKEWSPFI